MDNQYYTLLSSPVGALLVVATDRGLRKVMIGPEASAAVSETTFIATEDKDHAVVAAATEALQALFQGSEQCLSLPLDVEGTGLQLEVWTALRSIPRGSTRTYAEIAVAIGRPATAARAVGAACAANPVALAVPCHRAIGADGRLHGYRWGLDVKRRLLEMEGAIPPSAPLFERPSAP
jgi:O-6-methylguanine DNA methyltransferase